MRPNRLAIWERRFLSAIGFFAVTYSLVVLAYVATAPDLGLRCLLVDDQKSSNLRGLKIERVEPEEAVDPQFEPQQGDRLLEVAREPAGTFMHFTRRLKALRGAGIDPGGYLSPRADFLAQGDRVPPLVEREGERFVEVKFLRRDEHGDKTVVSWLKVGSLPLWELGQTLVWFLLEFGIFAVGAVAVWTRPFDRQARVFFAMCAVTMGGFVGGYHWWLIAAELWLTIPFVISAMLIPVVTLHFFLVYPEPKPPLARHSIRTLTAIYAIPAMWTLGLLGLAVYSVRIYDAGATDEEIVRILRWITDAVYVYLGIAAVYFLATLAALANSFFTIRNPILHSQVKWILWAAVVATVPVGYTLYLSHFHQEKFALGAASAPMFSASLLFMLAYAVGIVRYKLMLVDQILSRGMMYYILRLLVTAGFSLAVAACSLAGMSQQTQVAQQAAMVTALVMTAVLLLIWFRDRLQLLIDRRFFREKFQLDKALERMNRALGQFADPNSLAERMLVACKDLIGVDRAALYMRDQNKGVFRLIVAEGTERAPLEISTDQELLSVLEADNSLQRLDSGGSGTEARSQQLLRELDVELVHALESEGQIAGVLLLGAKRNGTPYSAEDLAMLTSLGQVTSVALQGAKVHQAVARLNDEMQLKIDKISEQQRMISMLQAEITARQQVEPAAAEPGAFRRDLIKGGSPAIRAVLETVRKASNSNSSVLVRGESGTGKELLAQAIHENSPRRGGPMVSVHCGALSAGLLESELFGHVKGAFTGAHRDKIGRFEMANGGTLFLDEIGDISLETQIKLLRVLQERSFEPVGGTRTIQVDVRLIAATHQNLERLIAEGKFREDLFYRLNVISITLPALRERADDIFELALYFLSRAAVRAGKRVTHLNDDAVDALRRYSWPGNIRELENAIERAVVLAEGPGIGIGDLPREIAEGRAPSLRVFETKPARGTPVLTEESGGRDSTLIGTGSGTFEAISERQRLMDALLRSGGNKAEAARLLGLPRSTFFSRLKKYGIDTAGS